MCPGIPVNVHIHVHSQHDSVLGAEHGPKNTTQQYNNMAYKEIQHNNSITWHTKKYNTTIQ